MKYVVYRTTLVFSLDDEDEKPCDGASKEIVDVFYNPNIHRLSLISLFANLV